MYGWRAKSIRRYASAIPACLASSLHSAGKAAVDGCGGLGNLKAIPKLGAVAPAAPACASLLVPLQVRPSITTIVFGGRYRSRAGRRYAERKISCAPVFSATAADCEPSAACWCASRAAETRCDPGTMHRLASRGQPLGRTTIRRYATARENPASHQGGSPVGCQCSCCSIVPRTFSLASPLLFTTLRRP